MITDQDFCMSPKYIDPGAIEERPYMHAHTLAVHCSCRKRDNKAMRFFERPTARGTLARLTLRLLCVLLIVLSCCCYSLAHKTC